jgi:hypothetical protein
MGSNGRLDKGSNPLPIPKLKSMTSFEFNKKYEDYLEEGHYGLAINIPSVVEFLDEIFSKVLIHLPDFKYSQIKLKFNSSRVYTNLKHSAMNYWIETEINNLVKKYDNDNNANS